MCVYLPRCRKLVENPRKLAKLQGCSGLYSYWVHLSYSINPKEILQTGRTTATLVDPVMPKTQKMTAASIFARRRSCLGCQAQKEDHSEGPPLDFVCVYRVTSLLLGRRAFLRERRGFIRRKWERCGSLDTSSTDKF